MEERSVNLLALLTRNLAVQLGAGQDDKCWWFLPHGEIVLKAEGRGISICLATSTGSGTFLKLSWGWGKGADCGSGAADSVLTEI